MNIRTARWGVAIAATSALFLTACGGDDDDDTTTETTDGDEMADTADLSLVDEGTLTVCSDIPYPPFEFEDDESPTGYTGFDIDLMQEIADRLELDLSVQVQGFDGIQSGTVLTADTCDVAASAMTITEEREENLNFTDPYYDSLQSLLVTTESGLTSLEDFSGMSLGVQGATTGAAYANENAPDGTEIIDYDDDGVLWQAMQAGNIDGILQDLPVNVEHAKEDGYELVEEYDTDEQYGFAVKEDGKDALLEAINTQLQEIRDDGTYDDIYNTYFSVE